MPESTPQILFLHIGWAREYQGASDDPVQGKFGFILDGNEATGEALNFRAYRGRYYGYSPARGINFDRVGGVVYSENVKGQTVDYIDDVLIIWTATSPADRNRYVVGWYKSARVYQDLQPLRPNKTRPDILAVAKVEDAHLVPEDDRTFYIPAREKGWPGTASAFYASDNLSEADLAKVLAYVGGEPSNGFLPEQNPPLPIRKGGMFGTDAEARAKVEKDAQDFVIAHYEGEGWDVDPVGKLNLGWDLTVTQGARELLVEVKGRAGVGPIVLTENERDTMNHEEARMLYRLAIVFNACTKPELTIFRYIAGRDAWMSEDGHTLSFEPMPGAIARF